MNCRNSSSPDPKSVKPLTFPWLPFLQRSHLLSGYQPLPLAVLPGLEQVPELAPVLELGLVWVLVLVLVEVMLLSAPVTLLKLRKLLKQV